MDNKNKFEEKNFEKVGHIKLFDNPLMKKYIQNNTIKTNTTTELHDGKGHTANMIMCKLDHKKIEKEVTEYYQLRFHQAFIGKELVNKLNLDVGEVFIVKKIHGYSANKLMHVHEADTEFVLVDKEKGRLESRKFFEELSSYTKIKNEEEKFRKSNLLVNVDFGSIIEYKDADAIIEGVVLDIFVNYMLVVKREDFKDILHNRKDFKDVKTKIIDKDDYTSFISNLVKKRFALLDEIKLNCEVENDDE